ncbi:MAG: AsmA family protein [Candidatus Omnitrophica bacterium]|nr:AsmA family protein [Candidatus Omnitrophota bacterium]
MSGLQRLIALIFAIGLVLLCSLLSLQLSRIEPDLLRKDLIAHLEKITDGTVSFEGFRLSRFPFLAAEFETSKLVLKGPPRIGVSAKKTKIVFATLPLLFGRFDVSLIEMNEGKVFFEFPKVSPVKQVQLENVSMEIHSIGTRRPMKFKLFADTADTTKAFSGEGMILMNNWKQWDWDFAACDGKFQLNRVDLEKYWGQNKSDLPMKINQGEFSGELKIHKAKGEPQMIFEGNASLGGFIYQMQEEAAFLTAPEMKADLAWKAGWNPARDEIHLMSSVVTTPLGNVEASGRFFLGTHELQDVRVNALGIQLESVPQYLIPFKDALPVNLGFSGQSDFEMSLQGTLDHLLIHSKCDITPALLTYSRFFSKPKDLPRYLNFDYLLKDGEVLSGDFCLRLSDVTFKGSLTDLNLKTGMGGVNFITNKFPMNGLQFVTPFFRDYRLEGERKVFANVNGNFQKLTGFKSMLNLTIENGKILPQEGSGIEKLHVLLDYGPLAIEMRKLEFELGASVVAAEWMAYNMATSPDFQAKVTSSHLEPVSVMNSMNRFLGKNFPAEFKAGFEKVQLWVQNLFPPGEALESLTAGARYKDKKWQIQGVRFQAYGGEAQFQAGIDQTSEVPIWWVDTQINRLSLARFLGRGGQDKKLVDGNLFLNAQFQGTGQPNVDWIQNARGDGSLLITNGEFHTFDLIGGMSRIDKLNQLSSFATGTTSFDDLRALLVLKDKKIVMDKLILISRDVSTEASGEFLLDGVLNYRLNVFLSPALTREVLGTVLDAGTEASERQLGPIPLLLSGPITGPELKPDPALVPELVDELHKRETQKILRNFMPEEYLFDRRSNN